MGCLSNLQAHYSAAMGSSKRELFAPLVLVRKAWQLRRYPTAIESEQIPSRGIKLVLDDR
jgi:hypothetical protein